MDKTLKEINTDCLNGEHKFQLIQKITTNNYSSAAIYWCPKCGAIAKDFSNNKTPVFTNIQNTETFNYIKNKE